MPAPSPTGVSMRDLLAACAAAEAVSRPPQRPEEARDGVEHAGARPAATAPHPTGDPARHPREAA
ncbi:hypothetical protein [Streptomyces roseochromogenus]|uniref:hypothetical protein n=1 Tax=Streptomyces roseochromogenus TaxID=285450 RepID=UPI000998A9ED|nr:hypothetical protein [Streptomyces roseochromogenus]